MEKAVAKTCGVSRTSRPAGRRHAHGFQHGHSLFQGFGLAQRLVHLEHLGQLIADGEHRVEGRHGFLKDHADAVAPDAANLLGRGFEQVLAVEQNLPSGKDGRGHGQQPQNRKGQHALAAARLSDDAQHIPRGHRQADVVHGAHRALGRLEVGAQVVDVQQGHAAVSPENNESDSANDGKAEYFLW